MEKKYLLVSIDHKDFLFKNYIEYKTIIINKEK